jgi:ABC-type glycerol-3-phosphate transport system substrate-binding protein
MSISAKQFFLRKAGPLIALAFIVGCQSAATPAAAPTQAPVPTQAAAKPAAPTTAPAAQPTTAPAAAPTIAPAVPQPTAAAQVELKWLQWWVTEWGADTHHQLIANFEAAHPNIKVTVTDVPWPDMPPKLQAAAAGQEVYDVFGTEGSWLSSLVKQNYAEDLGPWLKKDPDFANSLTNMTPMDYQGVTRGLCLYIIPYNFTYNVDMFQQKGIAPPTNWDEYVSAMQALKDPSNGVYGAAFPFNDSSFILTRDFGLRLAQEGGRWLDDKSNIAFNSPEGVAALQWWVDFYNKNLQVPGSFGQDQAFVNEQIAAGKVASSIDGPFVWIKVKQINPNVKMAATPPWKAATGGYSWACSGFGMNANTTHKQEAWEFMKYLLSKDVSINMTKKVSLVWATKASVDSLQTTDDPVLRQVPAILNTDPQHNIIYPNLPNMEKLQDDFGQEFQAALSGQKTAKQALDDAAKVWQSAIDQAR